jgi:hypothetical protein
MEDVTDYGKEKWRKVEQTNIDIILDGVTSVLVNGVESIVIPFLGDYGYVAYDKIRDSSLELLIQWAWDGPPKKEYVYTRLLISFSKIAASPRS